MSTKLIELKIELKSLAAKIRNLKRDTKKYQRENFGHHGPIGMMMHNLQWEYRHKHIAYCLLRGRTMEQIEKKNRKGNTPNQSQINLLMEKYSEEAICPNKA